MRSEELNPSVTVYDCDSSPFRGAKRKTPKSLPLQGKVAERSEVG